MSEWIRDRRNQTLLVYLLVVAATAYAMRGTSGGHFQTELDVIRANAARGIAEWLPHFGETAIMINSKAIAASGTLLPGVWFHHVLANLIAGSDPAGQLAVALLFHVLTALTVAALGALLAGGPAGAFAGLFYGVAPALGDLPAGFSNGPAILAFFWVAQAALAYARFIAEGHFGKLIATILCIFLAVSSDGIGAFSAPVIVGLELFYRSGGKPLPRLHRLLAVSACAGAAGLFLTVLFTQNLTDARVGYLAALSPVRLFKGLIWSLKAVTLPAVMGRNATILAAAVGATALLASVYRSLAQPNRLFPVFLFPFAVLLSLPALADPAGPRPDGAVGWLAPAFGFAFIYADLAFSLKNPAVRTALVAFLLVFMSLQSEGRGRIPVERGRRIRETADELQRLYRGMRDESDIYLIDDGVDTAVLSTAHLDFVYRYGLTRQTRFSLVLGGSLFADSAHSPVGRIGNLMRLELHRGMVFIGWDRMHEGLAVLNGAIRAQLDRAEKMMSETGLRIEPLPLGGRGAVEAWQLRPGDDAIPPDETASHWFMESPVIRLHSTIGRYDLRFE